MLTAEANQSGISQAMDFVEEELNRANFPEDLQAEILTAVDEIFSNIINYAYPPEESGEVTLFVSVDSKAVIRFEDSGKPYNPLEAVAPDLNTPLIERELGGLGIHFVKNMMDNAEYEYSGNKNIFTITKNLGESE